MNKTMLKTVIAVVLFSLCVIPVAYSALYAPPKTRIFFLDVPSAGAQYGPDDDCIVFVAKVIISSTYGPFTLFIVDQEKMNSGVYYYVDHWYTDSVFAANTYALLTIRTFTDATDVWSIDVMPASIVVTSSSPDQLSMRVSAGPRAGGIAISITAQFLADTTATITPRLLGGLNNNNPAALYNGVDARRYGLSIATVTGVPLAGRTYAGGIFRYIHTELYDPSLLA
jgi:hypothetical protein